MEKAGNRLLDALADEARAALLPLIETVLLAPGVVLCEPGDSIHSVHFPVSCIISLVQPYASGESVETATIGCEGMVCLRVALAAAETAGTRHLVQIGGRALRMNRHDFLRCLDEVAGFRRQILRHAVRFIDTALLSVACNRVHPAEQRLARWLLMTRDRCADDALPLTHDLIAEMLGVHRPTVTNALAALRQAGLVETRRGHVVIVDRGGLEQASCACYQLALPPD